MDITRHNFHEELDNILEAIEECTFLAIDGEFTGLNAEGFSHTSPLDTPAERYSKLRDGSTDFLLLQYGLCAFRFDNEKQIYEAKPYNFYLFPSPASRSAPDKRFLCQASSIDFLISHGFDFNKAFKEGIPFMTLEQEQKMRGELERKHSEVNNTSLSSSIFSPDGAKTKKKPMPVPQEHKEFINGIITKIEEHMDSGDAKPLELQVSNGFQRKLVYQTVEEKFPLAQLETKTGEKKQRYLVLHTVKDFEELSKKEQEKQALEMMNLDIQLGFTKVIQAIAKSGKLVVGHNMFLDVLHSVTHFHGALPQDLDDFKCLMKTVFPQLLDTKLLSNTNPFKDHMDFTSLDEVRLTLKQKPFSPVTVRTASGFEKYDVGNESLHEAGYDAFITGFCCATMCRFLGTFQSSPEYLLPTSPAVHPFINKLFLMRIIDIPYLNLGGPDLEVSREHVFHVTFPKEWRASDLHGLFEPYGNIQITWLSDHTAYVSLHNKKYAQLASQALSEQTGSFHVVSYAFHKMNKTQTVSRSVATKRMIQTNMDMATPNKVQKSHTQSDAKSECSSKDTDKSNNCEDASKISGPALKEELPKKDEDQKAGGVKLFEESMSW